MSKKGQNRDGTMTWMSHKTFSLTEKCCIGTSHVQQSVNVYNTCTLKQ